MSTTRSMLTALFAVALVPVSLLVSDAQCPSNSDFTIYQPSQSIDYLAATVGGEGKGDLINAINNARGNFWQSYDQPGGKDATDNRNRLAILLWEKDIYFLRLTLQMPQSRDLTNRRGPDFSANMLDMLNGLQSLDGGIRRPASPEYFDWVNAVQKALGPQPQTVEDMFIQGFNVSSAGAKFFSAVKASQEQYLIYVRERDWAEFDAKSRTPRPFDAVCRAGQACNYPIYLFSRYYRLSSADACRSYSDMRDALGNEAAIDLAANKVRTAAKTPAGLLVVTVPPPMKKTPSGQSVEDPTIPMPEGVIGVYSDPGVAFELLATQDDKRRFLLELLAHHSFPEEREVSATRIWGYAIKTYKQLQIAFGEQDLLSAAEAVRTAKIRMTTGNIMDQAAIGATRNEPFEAFEDILARKNPKGYVRAALAMNHDLDSPAAIQSAYDKFVADHGEKPTLEVARVAAADKPNINLRGEIRKLESNIADPSALAPKKNSDTVDFPAYLAWKGFTPNSKATYTYRKLTIPKTGTGDVVASSVSIRSTYLLQAVSSERAALWLSEIVYDYANGAAHPPHETEIGYPAKYDPLAIPGEAPVTVQSGEQTLTVAGKTLHTHWEKVQKAPKRCPAFLITTWTSPEVPGELVRKVTQQACGYTGNDEMMLESFQGSRSPAALDEATRRMGASATVASKSPDSEPFPMAGGRISVGPGTGSPQTAASTNIASVTAGSLPGPLPSSRTLPPANSATSAQTPRLVIPPGTQLFAHLGQMVDSSRSRPDTSYFGSLDQALVVNGVEVAPRATPVNVKLVQLSNGGGFTLELTDITIGGRRSAIASSKVGVSSSSSVQNSSVASALGRMSPAAAARAQQDASMRARQQASPAGQVLLNGTEVHLPPLTPLVFTLAGQSVQ